MQRRRAARSPVDGVLVLDKPAGLSSNAAMLWARRLFDARKAGHGGTLDPLATGVLPLLFGEATKFAADLLDADKTYEATLALGATTTTADAEGEIVLRRAVDVDGNAVRAACAAFVGDIEQVPPMHSALKRDGRPLYAYAREGVTIERAPRRVTIHAIELLRVDLSAPAPAVTIRVHCSKGTYVRTLAEDIGERLGCGAHLSALRRTAAGALSIAQAVAPQVLDALAPDARAERLLPIDALLQSLPRVDLDDPRAARFAHGQSVAIGQAVVIGQKSSAPASPPPTASAPPGAGANGRGDAVTATPSLPAHASATAGRVRVYAAGRLIGLGEPRRDGLLAPLRLVAQSGQPAQPARPATASPPVSSAAASAPTSTG